MGILMENYNGDYKGGFKWRILLEILNGDFKLGFCMGILYWDFKYGF